LEVSKVFERALGKLTPMVGKWYPLIMRISPPKRFRVPKPSDANDLAEEGQALLDVHDLRVRYPNGALGTVSVSLAVKPGSIVSLLGANGAGKSSTVRAICGHLRSERTRVISGKVDFRGSDITNREPHTIHGMGLALVPERRKIFPNLTVGDNLGAIAHLPPRGAREVVVERVHNLFPDLYKYRHQAAGKLSGGQQQMLAIARALLTDPKLLIVDEITLGLHPSVHARLADALRAVAASGTSILMADERASFALPLTDYCYVIRSGETVLAGRPADLDVDEMIAVGYAGSYEVEDAS
jgi:branched-chain amino acid transport system ATP-binding protein